MATQTDKEQWECEGFIKSATPGKYSTIVEIVTTDGETIKADFKDEWKVAPLIEVSLKNQAPFRWTGYKTDKGYKKVTWGFKEDAGDWTPPQTVGQTNPAINAPDWSAPTNQTATEVASAATPPVAAPLKPEDAKQYLIMSQWAIGTALEWHKKEGAIAIPYDIIQTDALTLIEFARTIAAEASHDASF